MPIFQHNDLPVTEVPRIRTRMLVGSRNGAESTTVWEQWLPADGHIPLHYHEVEEVLVILSGDVFVTLAEATVTARAPATILIPADQLHSLKPAGTEEVHLLAFFPIIAPKIFAPNGTLRPMPWEDTVN